MNKKIAMIGAGAWGTAVSLLLADNGQHVHMWCHEPDVARDISIHRENKRYFPGVIIPEHITATDKLEEALCGADVIFEATPVAYLRLVLCNIKEIFPHAPFATWVILSKGIEQHTNMLPTQILEDVFGPVAHAVVGGPNFATELAQKQYTTTIVASRNQTVAHDVAQILHNHHYFKTFTSNDTVGVQLGGAIKNVIALAVGIAQGAGYKDNARAYLITQGIHEIAMITQFLGGSLETAYGVAGLGDLILTATSDQSKNLRVGKMIGQGLSLNQITETVSVLPEGINTVQSLHEMIAQHHLVLPLCRATYDCIFQGMSFASVLALYQR